MILQELLRKIKDELKLRNYSKKTIRSYLACLSDYFKSTKTVNKEPDINQIKKYLLGKQERQSSQTVNLHLNSIKYFYREICRSNIPIDLKFAKRSIFFLRNNQGARKKSLFACPVG